MFESLDKLVEMAFKLTKPLDIKPDENFGNLFSLGLFERHDMYDDANFESGLSSVKHMLRAMELPPGVFIAGGFVRAAMELSMFDIHRTGCAGDIDMYVSGDSPAEAVVALRKLILWLEPLGTYVVSNYAVTVYVPTSRFTIPGKFLRSYRVGHGECYKIQVILERVPATGSVEERIAHIIFGYDLSCCKVATDGNEIHMSADAYETNFVTAVCRVERKIVGPATANRIRKYALAGYSFCFVDFTVDDNSEAMHYIRRDSCRTITGEINNYDDSYHGNTFNMDLVYKSFCKHGVIPNVIVGDSDYVLEAIDTLTADLTSLEAWEQIKLRELLDGDSKITSAENLPIMEELHRGDLGRFRSAYSKIQLKPLFEHPLERIVLTPDELEKKWCKRV